MYYARWMYTESLQSEGKGKWIPSNVNVRHSKQASKINQFLYDFLVLDRKLWHTQNNDSKIWNGNN